MGFSKSEKTVWTLRRKNYPCLKLKDVLFGFSDLRHWKREFKVHVSKGLEIQSGIGNPTAHSIIIRN